LGEKDVGGAEILKNSQNESLEFDSKKISSTRQINLAKAYGWWLAKGTLTLIVLKVWPLTPC
jgi:nucleolar MIF4G domain-containing protein 1